MISTFICQHCGCTYQRNPRLKNQKYCSSRVCQNARRNLTNKANVKKSSASRLLRQARNKRWRDAFPAHEYQKIYRENHPGYVQRNRDLQKERNKKRQRCPPPMIVKTYALSPQPFQDWVYTNFEIKSEKIVKTYALKAKMLAQSNLEPINPPNSS